MLMHRVRPTATTQEPHTEVGFDWITVAASRKARVVLMSYTLHGVSLTTLHLLRCRERFTPGRLQLRLMVGVGASDFAVIIAALALVRGITMPSISFIQAKFGKLAG